MILLILVAAHFIADFTLQPAVLAIKKTNNVKFLLLHSLIYAVVFAVFGFVSVKFKAMIWGYLIIILSHCTFDWLRQKIDHKFYVRYVLFGSFVLDQLLHLAVIIAVYFGFNMRGNMTVLLSKCLAWENVREIIVCIVIFIIIWDPASVFVKKLFAYLADGNEPENNDEPRAGNIIGKLERLIIAVLVISNQLSGIGFVLTAKSIARFKQFEKNGFAEKYLVGTLTSALIAIIVSLALRQYI